MTQTEISALDALAVKIGLTVTEDVPAAQVTTFRGGGTLKRLYLPHTLSQLQTFVRGCRAFGEEPFILGGGSDTVIADGEVCRAVVRTTELNALKMTDKGVFAECGARISALNAFAVQHGFGGLEFLCGVPATVGGALRMNAGAFGWETADFVKEITCLAPDGDIVDVPAGEVGFAYREGVKMSVLSALFGLTPTSAEESASRAAEYAGIRRRKQPSLPSCGSVFRGAEKPAGFYIERAGLKGARTGGAAVSAVHANFIVNEGNATVSDFLRLADLVHDRVLALFGVDLEREFVLLE